jgi:hypothetical protein
MSDEDFDINDGLREILDRDLARFRRKVANPLRELLELPSLTWEDVSAIIRQAVPGLTARLSPTGMQGRVAASFLTKFADRAERGGATEFDGSFLTTRGSSVRELFREHYELLGTSAEKLESCSKERDRVSNNLAAIVKALRDAKYAEVEHKYRRYVVVISIPEVKLGRGGNVYTVTIAIQDAGVGDTLSPAVLDLERRGFFAVVEEYWEQGVLDRRGVGGELEYWLREAKASHPAERVINVLNGLASHLDFDFKIYFVNALTGFSVHPLTVDPMCCSSDYVGQAWRQCLDESGALDEEANRVAAKIRTHVGFSLLEKAIALRVLRIAGADPFAFMSSIRGPHIEAAAAPKPGTAQNIYNIRLTMHDVLSDAQKWLDAAAERDTGE